MAESTVIVVGAGPSGLATAACLTHHSIPYILLEREDCCASLWKKKAYDRLHLHLPKEYCELPHMKMPSNYPKYVPKTDFLQYLDNYVDHFGIKPLYRRRVVSAKLDEGTKKWRVVTKKVTDKAESNDNDNDEEEEYVGRYLVVASGETCDPYCPEIEGLSSFEGKVVHSTQYRSGKEYEGKSVLVIGAGNSGIEIGLDLANYGAKTSIVVRSPVHILSKGMVNMGLVLLKHLPLKWVDNFLVLISKIVYGDVTKYGLTRPQEGPFYLKVAFGKYPIIDQGSFQKIKSGEIQILPAITSIRGNDVLFKDGRSYAFDSIIFATGFKRATNQWLKGDNYLLNEDGLSKQSFPNNWKGKNGLYCAGLARRGLYGAAMDAENISNDIKKHN
ncbi:probable indole-3-pyruvate monooxygenase YUCCA10 [Chenopodium quinoa]|uniref:probable indole-3-pyruvate monooxygenase YUCCA10 n=1 Tax=Chenopodium quinoa TaxID=63459 RepID=UPI000B78FB6C|nr:probable indole-3-pyruvate monooxygenase YUCCA10 [Chenopodium quinoa]